VALGSAVRQIKRDYPNVVMVAAAGNNGDTEPMYPAAFPEVIGVGALTAEYDAAPFSSRGDDVGLLGRRRRHRARRSSRA
jgi:subtilisin family serine protease